MDSEADAVIGDAVLRKVVCPDLLATIAAADLCLTLFGKLGLLALHLDLVEARAQNAHRLFAILDLRFFVLAAHDCVGWNMRDAHRRVCCIDGLSART